MLTLNVLKTHIEVSFPYNPRLLEKFKQAFPERRWSQVTKKWLVGRDQLEALQMFSRGITPHAAHGPEQYGEIPPMPELTIDIPLKREMFPFQKTGVAYALEKERLIIGDQPGLGKTTQAIAAICGADAKGEDVFPCLIVCPSSLKLNWQKEWAEITEHKAMLLNDSNMRSFKSFFNTRSLTGGPLADVFIVNYESLKKFFVDKIEKPEKGKKLTINHFKFNQENIGFFKSVIFDESHRLKDFGTQQSKISRGIAKGKKWAFMLTGTPVVNKPKDLCCQLAIIDQLGPFGGYKAFINRYCEGGSGFANLKELNYKLATNCFYQRQKSEVLKELPDKMRQIHLCDLSNQADYNLAEMNFRAWLNTLEMDDEKKERSLRAEILVQMGHLKRLSALGKLKDVYEFIDDVLASGEKLVLFVHTKDVGQAIRDKYRALSIFGEDSLESRNFAVEAFQNKNSGRNLIVCSIKAAGVGLTLTASSNVGFIELPWHAADTDQCEDRCHRIGQHDSVNCHYFLGKSTIDEKIYEIINEKRQIANAVTGAVDNVEVKTYDEVGELLNRIRN